MAYNVTTDFGANNLDNTGATNNATKFNTILATAAPFTLYFPAGTYLFTAQPNAIPSTVTIYGDGMNQTLIKGTRGSRVTDAVWTTAASSDITFKDLQFTTTDDANACFSCLVVSGSARLVLERIKFTNAYSSGVRTASTAQVSLSQCEFTHIYQEATASAISGALQNSIIENCRFYDNGGTLTTQHCIYLNGPASSIPSNVSIVGCVFQNYSGGQAVEIDGDEHTLAAQAITVDSCQFVLGSGSGAGIVFSSVQGGTINNCQFYAGAASSGLNGVTILGCDSWTVTNCVFVNSSTVFGGVGILLGQNSVGNVGAYGAIRGNQFAYGPATGAASYSLSGGIGLLDASNVLIEDNTFLGVGLAVSTGGPTNVSTVSNVTVRNNQFIIQAGATKYTSGGAYFGSGTNTYALAFDGPATNIRFFDNIVSGFTYEVYFTQSSYTGNVSGFAYRCGNFGSQGTFGFAGGAVPTGMVRWAAAQIPMTPSTVTAANITTVNE